jgi:lipoate-protein ligase A
MCVEDSHLPKATLHRAADNDRLGIGRLQDLGNSNYSFHVARDDFLRATHSELVVRALNAAPIELTAPADPSAASDQLLGTPSGAYVNARNDICVRVRMGGSAAADQGAERKVSGSAYKLISARAYHHGTMLLSAQLSALGSSLHDARGAALVSKGVASVPSPVVNLSTAYPHRAHALTHEVFEESVSAEFARVYGSGRVEHVDETHAIAQEERFVKGREELRSWQWTHGQTPEFTHELRFDAAAAKASAADLRNASFSLALRVKGGVIEEATLADVSAAGDETAIRAVVARMSGARYDTLATAPLREGGETPADTQQETERALRELQYTETGEGDAESRTARSLVAWLKCAL